MTARISFKITKAQQKERSSMKFYIADAFTETIWNSLNADNKVSLFTRFIDLKTGEAESRIVNKNQ